MADRVAAARAGSAGGWTAGAACVRASVDTPRGAAMRMDALAVIGRRRCCAVAVVLLLLSAPSVVSAQFNGNLPPGAKQAYPIGAEPPGATSLSPMQLPDLTKRENFSSAMQIIILLTVLSLAPAILIMMTSFTRIIIVLSLLRQALGTQQLPPNQVLIGLSMFMTFLVMAPTWQRVNSEALQPYMDGSMPQRDALAQAQVPVREFMLGQIIKSGNEEDIY